MVEPYRFFHCSNHTVIHFVRRGKFFVGCFSGKMERIIKSTIDKVAPKNGEPGKQALNKDQVSFFHLLAKTTKTLLANEDLNTSGDPDLSIELMLEEHLGNTKLLWAQATVGTCCPLPPPCQPPQTLGLCWTQLFLIENN